MGRVIGLGAFGQGNGGFLRLLLRCFFGLFRGVRGFSFGGSRLTGLRGGLIRGGGLCYRCGSFGICGGGLLLRGGDRGGFLRGCIYGRFVSNGVFSCFLLGSFVLEVVEGAECRGDAKLY